MESDVFVEQSFHASENEVGFPEDFWSSAQTSPRPLHRAHGLSPERFESRFPDPEASPRFYEMRKEFQITPREGDGLRPSALPILECRRESGQQFFEVRQGIIFDLRTAEISDVPNHRGLVALPDILAKPPDERAEAQ